MPSVKRANESQFFFFCSSIPPETFEVTGFQGTEKIGACYSFTIDLISADHDLAVSDILNTPASLFIFRDGEYCPYSGVITHFEYRGESHERAVYGVTMVARLFLLDSFKRSRIFQKKKPFEIIKQIISDAGLTSSVTYKLRESDYPEQEFVVQYQESDLSFITRLMETHGMWYFFTENTILADELDGTLSQEQCIITDDPANFTFIGDPADIGFRSFTGMVEQVQEENREHVAECIYAESLIPKEVVVKDYNYRTPEIDLKDVKTVANGAIGSVMEYGGHFKNATEAGRHATIAAKRFEIQRCSVSLKSTCRAFRAGKRFTLAEHPRDSLNAAFLLTAVDHNAFPEGETIRYTNQVHGIPAAGADHFVPLITVEPPHVAGIITAPVEANGSDYAALDDLGRYKVRMPYDISDAGNYEASRYIRLAQPYSGSQYGMHFPVHEGSEMVIACVNGNPDRPLGLATVANANTVSPVASANKAQNILRTAGGNELLMDDTDEKQKVSLTSKAGQILLLDDENKKTALQSTDQNSLILDDQEERVSLAAKNHSIVMNYKNGSEGITVTTDKGHIIKIDDNGKKITVQTAGGHTLDLDDQGKKITLADGGGKHTVVLDGNGNKLMLDTQGELVISAMKDVTIKGANIALSSSTGKIDIKATQDLTLAGLKITAKATTDLKLEGLQIEAKGTAGLKMQGLTAEIKGDISAKVSGTMAELSGSAMTTVKGAIVMIN